MIFLPHHELTDPKWYSWSEPLVLIITDNIGYSDNKINLVEMRKFLEISLHGHVLIRDYKIEKRTHDSSWNTSGIASAYGYSFRFEEPLDLVTFKMRWSDAKTPEEWNQFFQKYQDEYMSKLSETDQKYGGRHRY